MGDPVELILSTSAIGAYLQCPYRWYQSAVLRMPERLIKVNSLAGMVGSAVHAAAETWHKRLPLRPEEALRRSLAVDLEPYGGGDVPGALGALDDALRAWNSYQRNILPLLGEPQLVEADFAIRVNGTLVTGRIDFADQDVHDTKTSATPSKVKPEAHRLQLSIYRHGYRALLGHFPRRLLLDVVGRNGRWKQVEVQPDDREMADMIGLVEHGIMKEDFEPTGAANGSCKICPYWAVCAYAVTD